VPTGLTPYHAAFLAWVKESLDILIGARRSQYDQAIPPRSQAVVFADLESAPVYADNAEARTAGLKPGDIYRTDDVLKVVHN